MAGYSGSAPQAESAQFEVGAVQSFRFAPSSKWLLLDGGTHNFDDYPDLGALYGGSPGGSFQVDDYRGIAIYAADGSNTSGSIAGADIVDLTHTHGTGSLATASAGAHSHGGVTGNSGTQAASGLLPLLAQSAPPSHTHTISSDGSHTHTMSGSTASSLSAVDKRPRRGYLWLYIRALA